MFLKREIKLIKEPFDEESSETKVYVISGPKGCGKTFLLTYLSKTFKDEGYITIDLNPFEDLNEQFAAKVYKQGKMNGRLMQLKYDGFADDFSIFEYELASFAIKRAKSFLFFFNRSESFRF